MDALIDKLSSGQIVAVISIVSGAAFALAMIVAVSKYQFQALADDTALKREKQQSDLALREKLIARREATGDKASVEQLLALGAAEPQPDDLDVRLATRFGMLDAEAAEIERTLNRAMAADAARKKMIVEVMEELIAYDAAPEVVLAAIRPLCGMTKGKPAAAEPVA
jgi:hypothetical protein